MEISILDWIQSMRTPIGDVVVPLITRLGDAGMIWILLSVVLLLNPRTRKSGAILAAALHHTRAKLPAIEIHRQKIGKGKKKITYFAAEIQLSDATDLRAAFAHNQYGLNIKDTVSGMAKEHHAVFAVNGDYYGYRTDGIVLRNGILYRDKPADRDCLVMYKDGTARAMREGAVSGEKLIEEGAWNVFFLARYW